MNPYQSPARIDDEPRFSWWLLLRQLIDHAVAIVAAFLLLAIFPISAAVFLYRRWKECHGEPIGLDDPPELFQMFEGLSTSCFWAFTFVSL